MESPGGGGGSHPVAMEAPRRAAEGRSGHLLRESRQQSRDKASLMRPASTPARVAAGQVPLRALQVTPPTSLQNKL